MEIKDKPTDMKDLGTTSLVGKLLDKGGRIEPLIVPNDITGGIGLCNPSILHIPDTAKYLVNVRAVSYYLHHSEGDQKYQTPWGPLNYVRPDDDPYLRTQNYLCEFNLRNMKLARPRKVNTNKFPKEPEWDFVGLEDGRLVKWEGKLYLTGVRRYAPDGKGRMVLSEIELGKKKNEVREVGRYIIDPPKGEEDAYCEKNWMPILDMPFHYVKWSNPIQVVKVDINKRWKNNPRKYTCPTTVVSQGDESTQVPLQLSPRGGSQVVPYIRGGKKHYMAVTHECDYWHNKKNDRDSHYYHRIFVWDDKWNIAGMSEAFKFMDGRIEFSCGLARHPDKGVNEFYCTFGFQDNSAYLINLPADFLEEFINWSPPKEQYAQIVDK